MYQEVHTDNLISRAHAPEVADLLRLYALEQIGVAGARHEPLLARLMPQYGAELMVIAPTADSDYEYVHYGREIARYIGGTRLGHRISEMTPQVASFTRDCYDQALADGKPAYTVHRSLKTVRVALWERLILPTTAEDGARYLIVFSRPLQFREELLTTVLDTSPSGIVAVRAQRDEEGNVERAIIITANQRAAVIGGCSDNLHDQELREALPFLADPMIWRRCIYALELRRADMIELSFERDGQSIWLQIALAPLGDGLVLTITDVSELMIANQTLQSRAATLALEIGRERATRRALSHEIGQREEREKELRRLAETDPLTALLNRRSFLEKANQAIEAGEVGGQHASLIMVDLDHFKSVNDSYGHPAGDAIIRAFADLLLGSLRSPSDLVSRFGGEEFALFLPDCSRPCALQAAESIKQALASRDLPVSETLALNVSASFGVATRRPGESLLQCIERADQALYRAKHGGRSRICQADEPISVAA